MPRTCTICRHAKRREIEADVQAGLSYRDVARRHNISKDVICRHRAHVSLQTTPVLGTVIKIMALLDNALAAPTFNVCLVNIQETRRSFEELVRRLETQVH
jgi:hypothetical protein